MAEVAPLETDTPVRAVVGFCRTLRTRGLETPVADVFTFVRALGLLGLRSPDSLYWAGRATLVRRPEDIGLYDSVFASYFGGPDGEDPVVEQLGATGSSELVATDDEDADGEASGGSLSYSRIEVLREKNFAACTPAELAEAIATMREVSATETLRRSHRWRAARAGTRPDVGSTIRHSLRSGGEIGRLERTDRLPRARRLVLVADVSGSMEPYARALLRFAHVLVAGRTRVEAFALGTRLTRITRQLSSRDPDAAMVAASGAVLDWSGGTKLGAGLREFNDRFGIGGMARGAQVVILSDGWDRGDPGELASQMARLRRVAHQIIWVNPLKSTPGYEPLTQGMAAALPYVDRFLPGHNVASLVELLAALAD